MKFSKFIGIFVSSLLIILLLAGCGGGTPSPSDVTKQFLDAIKKKDSEKIENLYAGKKVDMIGDILPDQAEESTESKNDEELQKLVEDKLFAFDYSITGEEIKEDKASVNVDITTYKIGEALGNVFGEYLGQAFGLAFSDVSDEELDVLLNTTFKKYFEQLKEKDFKKSATVTLTKSENGWIIDEFADDSDLMDGITGGLASMAKSLSDTFGSSDDADNSQDTAQESETHPLENVKETISIDDPEGKLVYKKSETLKDYEGNPALRVYFDYTNLKADISDSTDIFFVQAFQKGAEIDTAYVYESVEEDENLYKSVQSKITIPVAVLFSLKDMDNDVTVRVTLYSESAWEQDDLPYQEMIIPLK